MTINQYTEPGDVKLSNLRLTSGKGAAARQISLLGQLATFSIYEDMMSPVMYAEIELVDAINIVLNFPIVGGETINIDFQTAGVAVMSTFEFVINSVDKVITDANAQVSSYVIKCVSPEQRISAKSMMYKSTQGQISVAVKEILEGMQSEIPNRPKRGIYVQDTTGLMGTVAPKLKPFAAIDYFRRIAMSSVGTSSSFVFFENQLGFHFRTIDNLIEEGQKKEVKVFNYLGDVMSSKEGSTNAQRNIIKSETVSRIDTIAQVQAGVLNSQTSGYDLVSKGIRKTDHNLSTDIKKFSTTDKKARSTITTSEFQELGDKPADTFFVPYDSSKGGLARDLSVSARRAFSAMLQQNTVRILIHGDNTITVGDLLELNFPEVTGVSGRKKPDGLASGKYLLTRARHIVVNDLRRKYLISAELIKVGYTI